LPDLFYALPMTDADLVRFLQAALPRLRLRWRGFRRVRGQVKKRLRRRLAALGLPDLQAYAAWMEQSPEERLMLDEMCRITISRFQRDRGVFDLLESEVLAMLAEDALGRGQPALRAWSAGCASGEEPYTLAIIWHDVADRFPGLDLEITATDAGAHMLRRARAATYSRGTLKELSAQRVEHSFSRQGELLVLRDDLRGAVTFQQQDIRREAPEGPFDLVLCRNLAFTYFEESLQREVLERIRSHMEPGGVLVIGGHEALPACDHGLTQWKPGTPIYSQQLRVRSSP